jgi:hypothetical protein
MNVKSDESINETIGTQVLNYAKGEQLLVVQGQINQGIIMSTIKLTEQKLTLEKMPYHIITRVKMVCIEMLQNIAKHQLPNTKHLPNIIVTLLDGNLCISTKNVVNTEDKNIITEKLERYKLQPNLKEYYKDAFAASEITKLGNAGLGLLDIVYRSRKNFSYTLTPLNDNMHSFNFEVHVSKQIH